MTLKFESRQAAIGNSFDIFEDQWISEIPIYGKGTSPLFFDGRIKQFEASIGGFAGKKVLELGPLEAGHTYAMSLLGASEILAVEANQDAFLRCLVVKEAFGLKARFICGDFEKFMRHAPPKVDVVLASGVLYHMKEPLHLIEAICSTAEQACFWTHYYDQALVEANPALEGKFGKPETLSFRGLDVPAARQSYKKDLKRTDFAGGMEDYSYWVTLDGLRSVFESLGFEMDILDRQDDHLHGPGVTFTVRRS